MEDELGEGGTANVYLADDIKHSSILLSMLGLLSTRETRSSHEKPSN